MRQPAGAPLDDVIIELRQNGAYVQATAVDPRTGVEVSIVGAASTPTVMLQNAATRKLRYVLEKRKGPARPERGLYA